MFKLVKIDVCGVGNYSSESNSPLFSVNRETSLNSAFNKLFVSRRSVDSMDDKRKGLDPEIIGASDSQIPSPLVSYFMSNLNLL